MNVNNTNFTIAEYCGAMINRDIIVNRDYQRSDKVWPASAQSYLLDTVLRHFPMPKLCLYQVLDLKTKKTTKEIVDGQQRSTALLNFYEDKLVISGQKSFLGYNQKYSTLDDELKRRFLTYQLSIDLFISATEDEIRELFRRMNSYNVPLNPQEIRHATYQGDFKWFVVFLSQKYSGIMKQIGVFTDKQLSRMDDSVLFTELSISLAEGIFAGSKTKLDKYYEQYGEKPTYQYRAEHEDRIDFAFDFIINHPEIQNGPLMRAYNFLFLLLAITHCVHPNEKLQRSFTVQKPVKVFDTKVIENLFVLANSLVDPKLAIASNENLKFFIDACAEGTNRQATRDMRFSWFCKALTDQM